MAAILNVRTAAASMNSVPATALDEIVANARRRFRRVLVAWAVDSLERSRRNGGAVRWSAPEPIGTD